MKNTWRGLGVVAGTLLCFTASHAQTAPSVSTPPRLVLQITVDALRGDLPTRFGARFGEGGYRYLLDEGVHYANAHYQHANTETIVGHVSLATGTVPAVHGMIANVWFDREQGRLVYNIEDARHRLLTVGADVDANTEIDPTQRAAKVDGRSPAAIIGSTFSDELAAHYGGASKIFGVSVKDRGAVSMAGHAGKAFWFSKASGEFVTSSYYYDAYPDWVVAWNAAKPATAYSGKRWELMHDAEAYRFGDADDRDWEADVAGFGRTFPHAYGTADDRYFTTRLTLGPAGDELTLAFAKALIDNEGLGQDDIPDYLAVSFSSTDYVGHVFGASSLESEDNQLRLDRTLSALFAHVERTVGLANTLIVLSADHGNPEVPGYLNHLGMEAPRHFDMDVFLDGPSIDALEQRFGVARDLVEAYFHPYVYLNRKVMTERGLDPLEVELAIAAELAKFDGVAGAFASSALASGDVADTPMARAVLNNYQAKRSGEIYLVFEPNVFVADFDGLVVASTHGSPWRYDTFVPIIFAGAGVLPLVVHRPVTPYDIAPTLAAYLGIKPPSGAVGEPLPEVLGE